MKDANYCGSSWTKLTGFCASMAISILIDTIPQETFREVYIVSMVVSGSHTLRRVRRGSGLASQPYFSEYAHARAKVGWGEKEKDVWATDLPCASTTPRECEGVATRD